MNVKQVKNAILDLLVREIPSEKDTIEGLGEKIEVVLSVFPLKRVRKDKDAPKKVITAYNFFCRKNRVKTMEKMNQESEEKVRSADVVRALACKWKELKQECDNGDECALAEMREHKAQSIEDIGRYHEEIKSYEEKVQGR